MSTNRTETLDSMLLTEAILTLATLDNYAEGRIDIRSAMDKLLQRRVRVDSLVDERCKINLDAQGKALKADQPETIPAPYVKPEYDHH